MSPSSTAFTFYALICKGYRRNEYQVSGHVREYCRLETPSPVEKPGYDTEKRVGDDDVENYRQSEAPGERRGDRQMTESENYGRDNYRGDKENSMWAG